MRLRARASACCPSSPSTTPSGRSGETGATASPMSGCRTSSPTCTTARTARRCRGYVCADERSQPRNCQSDDRALRRNIASSETWASSTTSGKSSTRRPRRSEAGTS
eukprot:2108605-Prorocentrum_lima.AAC.1